jgi:hypothetical protein
MDGCPLRWPNGRLRLVPCAGFELGVLSAEGSNTVDAESATRWWAAGSLVARLEWELAGPLVAELEGRVSAPFTRDQFYFRPNVTAYRTPAVTGSVGFGLGVRFW